MMTHIMKGFDDKMKSPDVLHSAFTTSGNGSACGWVYDAPCKIADTPYKVYPAVGIHGSDDGRHRLRYFYGEVIYNKKTEKTAPLIWKCGYGIKQGNSRTMEEEADIFVTDYMNAWKGRDWKQYSHFLERKVSMLWDKMQSTRPLSAFSEEFVVYKDSDKAKKYQELFDKEQTVFQAQRVLGRNVALLAVRRQLDSIHAGTEIIRYSALKLENMFSVPQPSPMINDIANAREAILAQEKAKVKPKKGVKK